MRTSPTDGFQDMEAVLFLLAELECLAEEQVQIEGLRLEVFETSVKFSRANDLSTFAGLSQ